MSSSSPEDLVRAFLAYRDMPNISAEKREELAIEALTHPRSRAYAGGVSKLIAVHSAERVAKVVRAMIEDCRAILARPRVEVAEWGQIQVRSALC
jgi:hypothetical protein